MPKDPDDKNVEMQENLERISSELFDYFHSGGARTDVEGRVSRLMAPIEDKAVRAGDALANMWNRGAARAASQRGVDLWPSGPEKVARQSLPNRGLPAAPSPRAVEGVPQDLARPVGPVTPGPAPVGPELAFAPTAAPPPPPGGAGGQMSLKGMAPGENALMREARGKYGEARRLAGQTPDMGGLQLRGPDSELLRQQKEYISGAQGIAEGAARARDIAKEFEAEQLDKAQEKVRMAVQAQRYWNFDGTHEQLDRRLQLLQSVIDDPHRDPKERLRAQRELEGMSKVDETRDIWGGAGKRLLGALAMGFGAYGATLAKTPNFAMQIVKANVDRAYQHMRDKRYQRSDAVKAAERNYNYMKERFDSERAAELAAKAADFDRMMRLADQKHKQLGQGAEQEKTRLQLEQFKLGMDQEVKKLQFQAAQTEANAMWQAGVAEKQFQLQLGLKKDGLGERAKKELHQMQVAKQMVSRMRKQFQEKTGPMSWLKILVPDWAATNDPKEYNRMIDQAAMNFGRQILGERLTDNDLLYLRKVYFPRATTAEGLGLSMFDDLEHYIDLRIQGYGEQAAHAAVQGELTDWQPSTTGEVIE